MKSKFKYINFLIIIFMLLGITACGGVETEQPSAEVEQSGEKNESPEGSSEVSETISKSDLIVAIPGEPSTLDPYAHSVYYGFIPATLIFDTLIAKDVEGNYIPELALDWKFADETTLILQLREDVFFHNGDPFTAEDVKFTLETGAISSFSSTLFDWFDSENTVVSDDYNIEIKLKYPYAPVLEVLSSYRAGIVNKNSYESSPEEFGRNPVGTGPLMMSDWVDGDRIELISYPEYWGDKTGFDKCVFRVIVEDTSRTIELETGGVDIGINIPFSDWDRLEAAQNVQLVEGKTFVVANLAFNNSLELFQDVRVRQALAHGLALEPLVQTVWEGTAQPAHSYYAESLLGYKEVGPREYDVEKAKALLTEAGYPDGFSFKITIYEKTLNQAFAEVVQSMWKDIGVDVEIEVVDLATFVEMNNTAKLTASLLTPNVPVGDPDAALILWPITRSISLRHNDSRIQELLDLGSSTYDVDERIAIYEELQEYLYEKTYAVPIANPTFAFGVASNVSGFYFHPSQVPDLSTVYFVD